MYKENLELICIKGIHYLRNNDYTLQEHKPWIIEDFVIIYDLVMKLIIFPWKMNASMNRHNEILRQQLKETHCQHVLELAAGSGSMAKVLPPDNMYKGTDITSGLLRQAIKKFKAACFKKPEFYHVMPDDLPFVDNTFSICLCILALNFFDDIDNVFQEIKRVLAPEGVFICCVPVPERGIIRGKAEGTLRTEQELKDLCTKHGFTYQPISAQNGPLLYFKALAK